MRSDEIRNLFIDYFAKQGHTHVPSSPVIPIGDPTLLFINAGMNQFKDVFLGKSTRPYTRACSSQKCIRAGGKHNDLDNVGYTARHHTFFEMLGNFSFGDYFKEDAIYFCWDLITNVYRLPKEKLWVTVFREDDDALLLWKKISGLPESRIIRMGEKDNFWSMGDTGPCGPCSELLIDQGEEMSCGPDCGIDTCDCDRFLELWNLVFMQYNRNENGKLDPLPRPSIDTGMGLERITAILQGVHSNFETDLLFPYIKCVEELAHKKYTPDENGMPFRVIADHARCLTFALADGAYPSNEGRGYVLRKILRRAFRFGLKLELEEPFIYAIVPEVISVMGKAYPEIKKKQTDIQGIIHNEEIRFKETLSDGMKRINEVVMQLKEVKSKIIPGDQIFRLYDTYGIPLDIIQDVASEEHLTLDMETYETLMLRQKESARSAQKDVTSDKNIEVYTAVNDSLNVPVVFDGYEQESVLTRVTALIKNGERVKSVTEGEKVEIILEKTPFYAESGGQTGDTGTIASKSGVIEIQDTLSPVQGVIIHRGTVTSGRVTVDEQVTAEIDKTRRAEIKKHHSATHLLHYALRKVLGDHVRQSGSLVEPDRLRFDFTHFKALTDEELEKITVLTNDLIRRNLARKTEIKTLAQAREEGAMALFGEKYSETVRMVSFGDISKELCGGTHVDAVGEIGFFIIISEGSVATGVRRIEALCGKAAEQYVLEREKLIRGICSTLRVSSGEIKEKIEKIIEDKKKLEKDLQRMEVKKGLENVSELLSEVKQLNGVNLLVKNCGKATQETLRNLGDTIKNKLQSCIVALGAQDSDRIIFLVMVTPDLVKKGYHAGNLVKKMAQAAGGNGGGRPDMAQAGAKEIDKLDQALSEIMHGL